MTKNMQNILLTLALLYHMVLVAHTYLLRSVGWCHRYAVLLDNEFYNSRLFDYFVFGNATRVLCFAISWTVWPVLRGVLLVWPFRSIRKKWGNSLSTLTITLFSPFELSQGQVLTYQWDPSCLVRWQRGLKVESQGPVAKDI